MIYRAYHICSNYSDLHIEFEFLTNLFLNNGFPKFLIESQIFNFLNSIYDKSPPFQTVSKKVIYSTFPYIGSLTTDLEKELLTTLSKHLPHCNFKLIFNNSFKIASFFHYKDKLQKSIRSSLIYKFKCPCSLHVQYIGMTRRHFFQRYCEHQGISARTGRPLQSPPHSAIRVHLQNCNANISFEDFSILNSATNSLDLKILESLHILIDKPNLNDTLSSTKLFISA